MIGWHRDHLVPLGAELTADPRCTLVHGDFFAMAADGIATDADGHRVGSTRSSSTSTTRRATISTRGHGDFYDPPGWPGFDEQLVPGWGVRAVVGRSAR